MKPDAIDHLSFKLATKFKQSNLEKAVIESLLQVLEEEENETRLLFAGNTHIKNDRHNIKQAYLLWQQQKVTNKSKKEICNYIANCISDISPRTIEKYIQKFTKGFNPLRSYDAYIL